MKKINVLFMLLMVVAEFGISQATFSKRIHVGLGDLGTSIDRLGDGYLLTGTYLCNDAQSQCFAIVRTDLNGDVLSTVEYQNFPWWFCSSNFNGNAGVAIESDSSYYFAGVIENNGNPGEAFLMKTDGQGDSLWMKSYGNFPFRTFHKDIFFRTDSTLMLFIEKEVGPDDTDVWLLEVDRDGNVVWEMEYGQQYYWIHLQDVALLPNGDIVFSYLTCISDPCQEFSMTVARINPQGDMLWESRFASYELSFTGIPFTSLLALDNGGFLVSWRRANLNGGFNKPPILIWLDSMGNITNQYNFEQFNAYFITDLIKTSNGNIIGVGQADLFDFPGIGLIGGWVFSFTQDGDKLWERFIQDVSLPDKISWFSGVEETDSSGIAITGAILTPIGYDIWFVKLDSMGCFEPGCTGELQVAGGVYSVVAENKEQMSMKLYPNPVEVDQLNIELQTTESNSGLEIIVYDMLGHAMKEQPFSNSIDVSGLRNGIYLLKINGNENFLPLTERFFIKR